VTAHPNGLGDLAGRFQAARDAGLPRAAAIADEAAKRFHVDAGFLRDYLTRLVRYDLGKTEEEGLLRFNALASEQGFCPRLEVVREYHP
jgi:predicted solute-binding protein